jgi:hypothetical protein
MFRSSRWCRVGADSGARSGVGEGAGTEGVRRGNAGVLGVQE